MHVRLRFCEWFKEDIRRVLGGEVWAARELLRETLGDKGMTRFMGRVA